MLLDQFNIAVSPGESVFSLAKFSLGACESELRNSTSLVCFLLLTLNAARDIRRSKCGENCKLAPFLLARCEYITCFPLSPGFCGCLFVRAFVCWFVFVVVCICFVLLSFIFSYARFI